MLSHDMSLIIYSIADNKGVFILIELQIEYFENSAYK